MQQSTTCRLREAARQRQGRWRAAVVLQLLAAGAAIARPAVVALSSDAGWQRRQSVAVGVSRVAVLQPQLRLRTADRRRVPSQQRIGVRGSCQCERRVPLLLQSQLQTAELDVAHGRKRRPTPREDETPTPLCRCALRDEEQPRTQRNRGDTRTHTQ